MEKPRTPISSELLEYCKKPEVSESEELLEQLKVLVKNHELYADCYRRQKALVDASKRRDK